MSIDALLLFLHLSAAIVWIGGMFFAYTCLRPAAVEVLEPPLRLTLWKGVFDRFFVAVWIAVAVLPLSGLALWWRTGWTMSHGIVLMVALGAVMIGIYLDVALRCFVALKRAVAAGDWPAGGAALAGIRQRVGLNLILATLLVAGVLFGRGA